MNNTYANHSAYYSIAEKFNDPTLQIGEKILNEEPYDSIDLTEVPSTPITNTKVYEMLKSLFKSYREVCNNYSKSGTHQPDFKQYIGNKHELYYLHVWLQRIGNEELQNFVLEGAVLNDGFDSTLSESSFSPSVASSDSSAIVSQSKIRKRRYEEQLLDSLLAREQRDERNYLVEIEKSECEKKFYIQSEKKAKAECLTVNFINLEKVNAAIEKEENKPNPSQTILEILKKKQLEIFKQLEN